MNRFVFASVIAAICGSAIGQTVVINQGAYSFSNGGEFNASLSGSSLSPAALTSSGSFETFCLEYSEHFQPGGTYYYTIDTAAFAGAGGAVDGSDPLDERTAYLYNAFITGGLAGYDYSNALGQRQADAGALQNAIWYLEQENASLDSALAVAFYNFAQGGIGQGLGDVRVLNPYSIADSGAFIPAQSQLIKIPAPGVSGVLAMIGLTGLRRRR
jgi:hypothetical protein